MKKEEFISRSVGLPWVDRACSWKAMDCWGVVVMYFRYVYGEELPCVEGYQSGQVDIIEGFDSQIDSGKWKEVNSPDGDCIAFMLLNDCVASHVGVIVDGGYVLHSAGMPGVTGQVRCDRLDTFKRFNHGDIKYFRYEGCRCL